jgi:hypothetical protein
MIIWDDDRSLRKAGIPLDAVRRPRRIRLNGVGRGDASCGVLADDVAEPMTDWFENPYPHRWS